MADTTLRPARPEEAEELSELAIRSKGHWGYDARFLTTCRRELTVAAVQCDRMHVTVAERGGELIGFYELRGTPPAGELDKLYVDPPAIGFGVGASLLRHAREQARDLGFDRLTIEADPYAEQFYLHAGAQRIGLTPSGSIPGRQLPQLTLLISQK